MCRPSEENQTHSDICEDCLNLEEEIINFVRFKYNGGRPKLERSVFAQIPENMTEQKSPVAPEEDDGLAPERTRQPSLEDILIANNLLKEFEDEVVAQNLLNFTAVSYEVDTAVKEREAAETLLLLSCST